MSEEVNRFQSPKARTLPQSAGIDTSGVGKPVVPFASGHARATWVVALLAIGMLMDLLGASSSYLEIQLLSGVKSGSGITMEDANANDIRQVLVRFGQMGVYFATVVAFMMWMHRAHRNLPAVGAENLKHSPGWAVGGWFVPFLNLVRPYQVMAEIWQESKPARRDMFPAYQGGGSGSALVGWWWAFFLIMSFTGNAAFRLSLRAESVGEMQAADWAGIFADLVSVPAALLAIMVVRGIDANQEERYESVRYGNGILRPTQAGSTVTPPG